MHPGDKAVLRLATGLGLAVLIAYGLQTAVPFVVCMMTVVVLSKPGPAMPVAKGVVVAAVLAALLTGGVLMVPLLEHYKLVGVLLTAVVLYAVFLAGARKPNPLTLVLVMAFTFIPVAGVAEQSLATGMATAIGVGFGIGVFVSAISHALFPDPPAQDGGPAAVPAAPDGQAARRTALQATLVVTPVYLLALTNPALYLAAIMKTVAVGQQVGATNARSAGQELVGSTLMGAFLAAVVWFGLTLRPNLWMLVLWLVAVAIWAGARLFRVQPTAVAPSFWLNAMVTMFILLGPAIEDAAVGKDVFSASATRLLLFLAVACYGWGMVWLFELWHARRTAAPQRA